MLQVGELQRLTTPVAAPAQDSANARDELLVLERFDQVIVGAVVECQHSIRESIFGGQHEDRCVAASPYPSANFQAIHAGQHPVEHDHVGSHSLGYPDCRRSVSTVRHIEALVGESQPHKRCRPRIVLNDKRSDQGICAPGTLVDVTVVHGPIMRPNTERSLRQCREFGEVRSTGRVLDATREVATELTLRANHGNTTMTSSDNARQTSASGGTYAPINASTTPSPRPPITAPRGLSMPPRTALAKA